MKVILATDGTAHSDAAVDIIRTLSLSDGDEVKVISVVDMAVPLAMDIYAGYLPSSTDIEAAVKENTEKVLGIEGGRWGAANQAVTSIGGSFTWRQVQIDGLEKEFRAEFANASGGTDSIK